MTLLPAAAASELSIKKSRLRQKSRLVMQYIPLAYQSGADLPVRPWGPGLRTPAAGKNAAASGLASLSAQPNATHFACRGWWNFWTIESIIEPGGVKGMKMQKNKIAQNLMVLRQLHQLSQEEVAGRIGVSRQAVAKWETGFPQPKVTSRPRSLLPAPSGRNRVYRKTTCLKKSVQKLTLQGSQNSLPGGSFRMVVSVFVQNRCCVFVLLSPESSI